VVVVVSICRELLSSCGGGCFLGRFCFRVFGGGPRGGGFTRAG